MVRNSFIEKVTVVNDLEELRKLAIWISRGRELQADGTAVPRSKGRDLSGVVLEILRRAVCLEQSEHEEK